MSIVIIHISRISLIEHINRISQTIILTTQVLQTIPPLRIQRNNLKIDTHREVVKFIIKEQVHTFQLDNNSTLVVEIPVRIIHKAIFS